MILKVLGCLIIISSCTYLGFKYAASFQKRVSELDNLTSAIVELKNHIEYTHTSLPEAFLNISINSKEPVASIFNDISDFLFKNKVDSVNDAFLLAFDKNKSKLHLKNNDIDILLDLSKTLGEWNLEGHRNIFEMTISKMKSNTKEAKEQAVKNIKMYRYLGFSLGAMLVIVLI